MRKERTDGASRSTNVAGPVRDLNAQSNATLAMTVRGVERKFLAASGAFAPRSSEADIHVATAPLR